MYVISQWVKYNLNLLFTCETSVTKPVCMGSQVFRRRDKGKGLTLEVGRNADSPYSDRQRHNDLISVPNRNASGVNEHLIPEICR